MIFPLIWSGRIRAGEVPVSSLQVASQLESRLASCSPRSLVRSETLIDFVPSRRLGAWNVLYPASHGHIDVRETSRGIEVFFEVWLSALCFKVACLLMCTGLFAFVAMRDAPLLLRLLVFASLPCFVFGVNFAIFRFRFRRLIQQAVVTASGTRPELSKRTDRAKPAQSVYPTWRKGQYPVNGRGPSAEAYWRPDFPGEACGPEAWAQQGRLRASVMGRLGPDGWFESPIRRVSGAAVALAAAAVAIILTPFSRLKTEEGNPNQRYYYRSCGCPAPLLPGIQTARCSPGSHPPPFILRIISPNG